MTVLVDDCEWMWLVWSVILMWLVWSAILFICLIRQSPSSIVAIHLSHIKYVSVGVRCEIGSIWQNILAAVINKSWFLVF